MGVKGPRVRPRSREGNSIAISVRKTKRREIQKKPQDPYAPLSKYKRGKNRKTLGDRSAVCQNQGTIAQLLAQEGTSSVLKKGGSDTDDFLAWKGI